MSQGSQTESFGLSGENVCVYVNVHNDGNVHPHTQLENIFLVSPRV